MLKEYDIKRLIQIEKRLKDKLDKSSEAAIQIREIMVIPQARDRRAGESSKEGEDVASETSASLISRMTQHIENMAAIAAKRHIADNYIRTVDGEKVLQPNNITRLSFSEFSFYPSKQRGPLTEAEFSELMDELVRIGKTLPPNLHLVLSSFPVVDAAGNVHNVASYVQCSGSQTSDPIITSFAKTIPHGSDVLYPGTRNAYLTPGHNIPESFSERMIKKIKEITETLEKKDKQKSAIELIKDALVYCTDSRVPQPERLIKLLEELRATIIHGPLSPEQVELFIKDLSSEAEAFKEFIDKASASMTEVATQQIKNFPLTSIPQDTGHHGWSYGGNVQCITQGGAEFTTAIDICFDHVEAVAKQSHRKDLSRRMEHLDQTMDSQVTHLITANTVSYNPENIISSSSTHVDAHQAKTGVHSDSMQLKMQDPEEEITRDDPAFGPAAHISVEKRRAMGKLRGEAAKLVDKHNKLFIKIEALRILDNQAQDPVMRPGINMKLIQILSDAAISSFDGAFSMDEQSQLKQVALAEFLRKDIDIDSPSLGTDLAQVQDTLKDYIYSNFQLASFMLTIQDMLAKSNFLQVDSTKEKIVNMMVDQVVTACEHWKDVCPKTQQRAINLITDTILKNDQVDFSNSPQLVAIMEGLQKQVQGAIFEKTNKMFSFHQPATKSYGIHFDSLLSRDKGLSETQINGVISATSFEPMSLSK